MHDDDAVQRQREALPAASTSRHGSTARVIGTMRRNSVPAPALGRDLDPTAGRLDAGRTTSRPTPRPEMSDSERAVESPDWKMSCSASSSVEPVGVDALAAAALARTRVDVDAAAVVGDRDDHLGTELHRVEAHRAVAGLPAASRSSGLSMPWSTALRTRWRSESAS